MRRILIALTVIALLVIPQVSFGDDLDDLKAFDALGQKLNYSLDPKDIEAYVSIFHKEFVGMDSGSAFPAVMTKEQLRQGKLNTIASIESISYAMEKAIYRVVGQTGIVYHYGTETVKPKDGPAVTRNLRFSIICVKTDGKWLVVAYHASVIPSGD